MDGDDGGCAWTLDDQKKKQEGFRRYKRCILDVVKDNIGYMFRE